ncbi:MAG: hypothetical protein ACKVQW_03825 [Pyrinomonadaceae bacterium]
MNAKIKCFILLTLCSTACNSEDNSKWKTVSVSPDGNNAVNSKPVADNKKNGFMNNLPAGFAQPTDDVGRRMLKEYGAMFVSNATPPKTVVFRNDAEAAQFQTSVQSARETIGDADIELQSAAMKALKEATAAAAAADLTITPRGDEAAKRSYQGTVELWKSRVEPGLEHWVAKGRLAGADADRIRTLSPYEQVPEIFKLESQGIFFSKDLSKSIVYSVAPPGTSQHLSMLALDVEEFENARVRAILAKHGWHQTVVSDLPHFTYLGVQENELAKLGLKKVTNSGRVFWVPDI